MKRTDKLKKIYEQYKHLFQPLITSFHNLLWQVMINESMKGKGPVAFTAIVADRGCEMVIASADGGYYPTGVKFVEEIEYNKASDHAEEISSHVFGHSKKENWKIVARSMRKKGR
jgi:hypothetical protein